MGGAEPWGRVQEQAAAERAGSVPWRWARGQEASGEGRTPWKRTRVDGQGRWPGGQAQGTRGPLRKETEPTPPSLLLAGSWVVEGRDSALRWG